MNKMPTPPKNGKAELKERREIIRSLLARGINKPGRILKAKALQGKYDTYKNKYMIVKTDIEAVRKENLALSKLVDGDTAKGDLMVQYEETLQKAWSDLGNLQGRARVSMLEFIHELNKDIARLNGIDPERIDPKHFQLNVENDNSIRGPVELVIDSEDFMKRELEFAERLIKQRRGNVGGE